MDYNETPQDQDGFGGEQDFDGGFDHHEDHQEAPHPASAIKIGKKNFAVGLTWHRASDDAQGSERRLRVEAKREALESNHDLFCVFGMASYGFGARSGHQKPGMPVLAAVISDAMQGDFIVAYEVYEGHYYVLAVRSATINPHTDIIIDEAEAHDTIVDLMREHTWRTIVAPEHFNIPNSVEGNILSVVKQSRSQITLVDATNRSLIMTGSIVLGAITLLGAAYFGYDYYTDYQQQQVIEQQKHQQAESDRLARKKAIIADQNKDWPYDNSVLGAWSLSACENAIMALPTILPDYLLVSMHCDAQNMRVIQRFIMDKDAHASYMDVAKYVKMQTNLPHTIHHDKQQITVSYDLSDTLEHAPRYPKHAPSLRLESEVDYLDGSFDHLHRSEALHQSIEEPKAPNDSAKKKSKKNGTPVTVFRQLNIQITDGVTPSNYTELLAPLKAFVVKDVSYDTKTGMWKTIGTAYQSTIYRGDK